LNAEPGGANRSDVELANGNFGVLDFGVLDGDEASGRIGKTGKGDCDNGKLAKIRN